MKKFITLFLTLVLSLSVMTACGNAETETTEEETTETVETTETEATDTEAADAESTEEVAEDAYKIGILQLTEHAALDASNQGFVDAVTASGLNVVFDQQNAQGDQPTCQTIATKLVSDESDLILAIATPAAQAVAGATTTIPVIATAITDFVSAGLVNANDIPGTNVSGTSDLTPVKEQFELMVKLLPEAKTVGILYCSAESNSEFQAALAIEACEANGLAYEVYTVASTNEIQTVVESMVGNVDVIYAPTDNTIAQGMATVAMIANDNMLPVICGEAGMVNAGGLATYGIDYYQLGYLAGEMAVKVLKGEATISELPVGFLDAAKCELTVNEETAALLGVDLTVLN